MTEATAHAGGWLPSFRAREVAGCFVLTGAHGRWMILTQREYLTLKTGNPSEELLGRLEKACLIETEANEELRDQYFHSWTLNHFRDTRLHIVVVTRRCNLRCHYCHAAARPFDSRMQDLTRQTAQRIVDFIFQGPEESLSVEFQGGEPLLNFAAVRDVVALTEERAARQSRKIWFAMASNLTLLDREALDFISRHNIALSTSIDGPQPVHDLHRVFPDGSGSFDLVKSKMELARARGIDPGVLTTLTNKTLPFYREILDQYALFGQRHLNLNPVKIIGHARKNPQELAIPVDVLLHHYREIMDYCFEKIQEGGLVVERFLGLAISKLASFSDTDFMDFRSPCGAVFGQLVYDVNGDIYPCDQARSFPEFRIGNVHSHSYRDIVQSDKAWDLVMASLQDHPVCDECAYRPFCGLCPMRSYSEGDGLEPIPYKDFSCRLNLFLFDYVFEKLIQRPRDIACIADGTGLYADNLFANTGVPLHAATHPVL